jgi:hypothetical protein
MGRTKLTVTKTLEHVRSDIAKLAPQGPKAYRQEAHKVEYLRNSVLGATWATTTLASAEKRVEFSETVFRIGLTVAPLPGRVTGTCWLLHC